MSWDGYERPSYNEMAVQFERVVTKLENEYRRKHPDADEGECWAEAETARQMLDVIPEEIRFGLPHSGGDES